MVVYKIKGLDSLGLGLDSLTSRATEPELRRIGSVFYNSQSLRFSLNRKRKSLNIVALTKPRGGYSLVEFQSLRFC